MARAIYLRISLYCLDEDGFCLIISFSDETAANNTISAILLLILNLFQAIVRSVVTMWCAFCGRFTTGRLR